MSRRSPPSRVDRAFLSQESTPYSVPGDEILFKDSILFDTYGSDIHATVYFDPSPLTSGYKSKRRWV